MSETVVKVSELADELERLDRLAAPAPWNQLYPGSPAIEAPSQHDYFICDEGGHSEHDAALIVALRNRLPDVLAALRELAALKADQP